MTLSLLPQDSFNDISERTGDFFVAVAAVLNMIRSDIVYTLPPMERAEEKTPADYEKQKRLIWKLASGSSGGLADFFKLQASGSLLEDPDESKALLTGLEGTVTLTGTEQAELDAISMKLDAGIGAFYNGRTILFGPQAKLDFGYHESLHALRHQSMGVLELHSGYSESDRELLHHVEGLIPVHTAEFVAELYPIIGQHLGTVIESTQLASVQGLERAVQYFKGGYRVFLDDFLDSVEAELNSAIEYMLRPPAASLDDFIAQILAGLYRLTEKVQETAENIPYIVMLDSPAAVLSFQRSFNSMNYLGFVGGFADAINQPSDEPIAEKYSLVAEKARSKLEEFKANRELVTLAGLDSLLAGIDRFQPYLVAHMAINFHRDRLASEWPNVFFMPSEEIEQTYFVPIEGRVNRAIEAYSSQKL